MTRTLAETPAGPDQAEASAAAAPCKVLVVDDDLDVCQVTANLLTMFGYSAQIAESLLKARRLCVQTHFDLVITELDLCDGSGLDLLHQPRPTRPTHGIVISSNSGEYAAALSLAAGFDSYLIKPIGFSDILAAIQSAIGAQIRR